MNTLKAHGSLKSCTSLRGTPVLVARPRAVPALAPRSRAQLSVNARYGGSSMAGRSGQPEIVDRVIAALPYLLPFFNAFSYGRYLFYM